MQTEELSLKLANTNMSALAWGPQDGKKILALHGWLDNAASFIPIAEHLKDFRIIALDFPGHGHSDHKPAGCYFHFVDYIADVAAVLDYLGWQQAAILGHSLGAGIGSMLAGIMPERITALGLIDGLGPITIEETQLPTMLRKSIDDYARLHTKKLTVHPNKEAALKSRLMASKMQVSSAELLVHRGLKAVDGGFSWRSDQRLLLNPLTVFTEAQTAALLRNISSKTCLIRPSPGWPFDEQNFIRRINYIRDIEVHRVEGEHHVHMDDPATVGKIFAEFFQRVIK